VWLPLPAEEARESCNPRPSGGSTAQRLVPSSLSRAGSGSGAALARRVLCFVSLRRSLSSGGSLSRLAEDEGKGQGMGQGGAGPEKPLWVILSPLEHFLSGHATRAEAEAQRLTHEARTLGRPPHYAATPRRQIDG
jgi:hypothetical protein